MLHCYTSHFGHTVIMKVTPLKSCEEMFDNMWRWLLLCYYVLLYYLPILLSCIALKGLVTNQNKMLRTCMYPVLSLLSRGEIPHLLCNLVFMRNHSWTTNEGQNNRCHKKSLEEGVKEVYNLFGNLIAVMRRMLEKCC